MPPDQQKALLALASPTGSWGSTHRTGTWDATKPCLQWAGVECSYVDGSVIGLNLTSDLSGLNPTAPKLLPAEVASLTSLTSLDLSRNSLQGAIPSRYSSLGKLKRMVMSRNSLSGAIEQALSCLEQLEILDLGYNSLSEQIPPGLSKLTGLTRLVLNNNFLSGTMLKWVAPLLNLKHLDMSSNQLSGDLNLATPLLRLGKLTHLSLSKNFFSGSIPDPSDLSALRTLFLHFNLLSGQIPGELGSLTNLQTLRLSNNQMSGPLPEELSKLTQVQEIDMRSNQLSGAIPASLSLMEELSSLTLSYNRLNGYIPSALFTLKKLQILELKSNALSGRLRIPLAKADMRGLFDNNYLVEYSNEAKDNFVTVTGNCILNADVKQRNSSECRLFCNSTEVSAICGGVGVCTLGDAGPECECKDGYKAATASDIPTCTVLNQEFLGLRDVTNQPLRHLNRWSRYLSRTLEPNQELRRWSLKSNAFAFAPGNQLPPERFDPIFKWKQVEKQSCASCWLSAAADAVAAAAAIVTRKKQDEKLVPLEPISTEHLAKCSLEGAGNGCSGGMPAAALEIATTNGTVPRGTPFDKAFCTGAGATKGRKQVLMYETVSFNGWFGLLLTVEVQPVIVSLEGSYPLFQQWSSISPLAVFNDPACYSGSLDHVVLVVGYQLLFHTPYWIIRNSWGKDWVDGGYMKLAMMPSASASGDPYGVCGIYVNPGVYPVPMPTPGSACYKDSADEQLLNPCGGGDCKDLGELSYSCDCTKLPSHKAVQNTVLVMQADGKYSSTQTCVPVDACGLSAFNPCGAGNCVNDGSGDYTCLCPFGYDQSKNADSSWTCFPTLAGAGELRFVTVDLNGVTCEMLYITYGLSREEFLEHNTGLDCSKPIVPLKVVNVSNVGYPGCMTTYMTAKGDTCNQLEVLFDLPQGEIQSLNPGVDCANLPANVQICVQKLVGSAQPQDRCLTYAAVTPGRIAGSTVCNNIIDMYFQERTSSNGALLFYTFNPGINCTFLDQPAPQLGYGRPPFVSVCVYSPMGSSRACRAGSEQYNLRKEETCGSVAGVSRKVPTLCNVTAIVNHYKKVFNVKRTDVCNNKGVGLICFPKPVKGKKYCQRNS